MKCEYCGRWIPPGMGYELSGSILCLDCSEKRKNKKIELNFKLKKYSQP